MSNLDWVLRQLEGQFFERKSCFDRLKGKLRPARSVARDVAEVLAAMRTAPMGKRKVEDLFNFSHGPHYLGS